MRVAVLEADRGRRRPSFLLQPALAAALLALLGAAALAGVMYARRPDGRRHGATVPAATAPAAAAPEAETPRLTRASPNRPDAERRPRPLSRSAGEGGG